MAISVRRLRFGLRSGVSDLVFLQSCGYRLRAVRQLLEGSTGRLGNDEPSLEDVHLLLPGWTSRRDVLQLAKQQVEIGGWRIRSRIVDASSRLVACEPNEPGVASQR